jgi:hypothetical protein
MRVSKAFKLACGVHPEGDMRAERALGRALISLQAHKKSGVLFE